MGVRNFFRGFVTTVAGLVIIVLAVLDFFNVIRVPAPEAVNRALQLLIAFAVGLALFLLGPTKVEHLVLQLINKYALKTPPALNSKVARALPGKPGKPRKQGKPSK